MATDDNMLLTSRMQQESLSPHDAENAARRLVMRFRRVFDEADADGSGQLDVDEMCTVVKICYRETQTSRSSKVVQREVDVALLQYDKDGSGSLDFTEFVHMVLNPELFKFRVPPPMVAAVITMVGTPPGAGGEAPVRGVATEATYEALFDVYPRAMLCAKKYGWEEEKVVRVFVKINEDQVAKGISDPTARASGALDVVVAQLKQEQLSSKQRQWGLNKIVWVLSKKDNKGGKLSSFANWASQAVSSTKAEYSKMYLKFGRAMLCGRRFNWPLSKCISVGKSIEEDLKKRKILPEQQEQAALDMIMAKIRQEAILEKADEGDYTDLAADFLPLQPASNSLAESVEDAILCPAEIKKCLCLAVGDGLVTEALHDGGVREAIRLWDSGHDSEGLPFIRPWTLLEELFLEYDLDGSGLIDSEEELLQLTTNLRMKLPGKFKVSSVGPACKSSGCTAWTLERFVVWFAPTFGFSEMTLQQLVDDGAAAFLAGHKSRHFFEQITQELLPQLSHEQLEMVYLHMAGKPYAIPQDRGTGWRDRLRSAQTDLQTDVDAHLQGGRHMGELIKKASAASPSSPQSLKKARAKSRASSPTKR